MKASIALLAALLLCASCAQPTADSKPASARPEAIDKPGKQTYSYDEMLDGLSAAERSEITALVDDLIDMALGNSRHADPRTQVLLLTWFVHANFESVDVSPYSIARMLREQKAQCGGSSIALQLMARRLGYRTRTAAFFGVPNQGGHTVAEVEWHGRWHFVDPTYGAFLTADGTLEGEVVSFDTLKAYRYGIWRNTYYAKSAGRLGKAHPARTSDDLATLFSLEASVLAWTGDYKLFLQNYKGATVFDADEGKTLEAEFEADFERQNPVTIGTDNGDSSDITLHMQTYPNYDATALQFLGDMSGTYGKLIGSHSYRITGLAPGDVLVYRARVLDGLASDIDVTSRMVEVIETVKSEKMLELRMRALRKEAEIHLAAQSQTSLIFDSHRFERLR